MVTQLASLFGHKQGWAPSQDVPTSAEIQGLPGAPAAHLLAEGPALAYVTLMGHTPTTPHTNTDSHHQNSSFAYH